MSSPRDSAITPAVTHDGHLAGGPVSVPGPASPERPQLVDGVVLDRAAAQVLAALRDPVTGAPDLAEEATGLFVRSMRGNLGEVVEPQPDGTSFVLTGDIPAMWLRDSAAQVRPYLVLASADPALTEVLVSVLRRQLDYLVRDPYANAFKREGDRSPHDDDRTFDGDWPDFVWERKYEIDSLCFPLDLAHRLWRIAGRVDVLDDAYRAAVTATLELWEREQDHSRSPYRFERESPLASETLSRGGLGEPVGPTGMTWSAFRPSDDACRWNYNVPGNMFAAAVLRDIALAARTALYDEDLAARAERLGAQITAGIEEHGLVDDPEHGRVYAYEVDGLGNHHLMDDANMPSLLSAPLSGYLAADDPRYLATRRVILSPTNPHFHSGTAATGIGSPHTPPDYVWPIALAVQGLTATDRAEKLELLRTLCRTTAGTGRMHEGFHCDDPTRFTRDWFSWADAMFCELVLDLAGLGVTRPLPPV